MARRVVLLVFPDFQLLDVAGPLAAFEHAELEQPGSYRLELRASSAGPVPSSSGVALSARALGSARQLHTVLLAGGNGSRLAARCARTQRYIRSCAQRSVRIGSVCSGAYLLAATGLLDGLPATTHWSRSLDFARCFPRVVLQPDRIFTQSGNLWTSAGISAGIDLALAMIAEDLGEAVARRVAQQLVVYYRRPGGQSQFSPLLELEANSRRFAALFDYVRCHLRKPLDVNSLAREAGMSPRNFSRVFRQQTGLSPAQAVERVRAETARAALQSSAPSIEQVAKDVGFGHPERMRRAFVRCFGVPPASIKRGQTVTERR